MKDRRYPVYEAKAKLSQAVREAREGYRVLLTVHGRDAVELVPVREKRRRETLDQRIARLTAEGVLRPAEAPADRKRRFPVIARRPGALKRFLDSRD